MGLILPAGWRTLAGPPALAPTSHAASRCSHTSQSVSRMDVGTRALDLVAVPRGNP